MKENEQKQKEQEQEQFENYVSACEREEAFEERLMQNNYDYDPFEAIDDKEYEKIMKELRSNEGQK